MENLIKEFKKLEKVLSKNCTIYIELDLVGLKEFFIKYGSEKILNFFFLQLKKLVGKNGNIIIPSFTYSWGSDKKNKIFDINNTLPTTGAFPNFLFKKKREICRTRDPMFSFLIYGKNKNYLKRIAKNSFGKKSLFEKINNKNCYLISFGLNRFDPTFVHYVEEYFDENIKKINYRFLKKYKGFYKSNNIMAKGEFFCFSRSFKHNRIYTENNIKRILRKHNKLKIIKFLDFDVFVAKAKDFFDYGITGMKKNKYFFSKVNDQSC